MLLLQLLSFGQEVNPVVVVTSYQKGLNEEVILGYLATTIYQMQIKLKNFIFVEPINAVILPCCQVHQACSKH